MKNKTQKLPCRECGNIVENVACDATAVTCSPCVTVSLRMYINVTD